MKRTFLTLALITLSLGQISAKVTIKQLLHRIDWNMCEAMLIDTYPNLIQKKEGKTNGVFYSQYYFHNIDFGGKLVDVGMEINPLDSTVMYLHPFMQIEHKPIDPPVREEIIALTTCVFGPVDKDRAVTGSIIQGVVNKTWYYPNYKIRIAQYPVTHGYSVNMQIAPSNPDARHFRQSRWGDSFAQFNAAERDRYLEPLGDGQYGMHIYMNGISCQATCRFIADKLVKVSMKSDHAYQVDNFDFEQTFAPFLTDIKKTYGLREHKKRDHYIYLSGNGTLCEIKTHSKDYDNHLKVTIDFVSEKHESLLDEGFVQNRAYPNVSE